MTFIFRIHFTIFPACQLFIGPGLVHGLKHLNCLSVRLTILASYKAKTAQISNLWTFWPIIPLISDLFKFQQKTFLPYMGGGGSRALSQMFPFILDIELCVQSLK